MAVPRSTKRRRCHAATRRFARLDAGNLSRNPAKSGFVAPQAPGARFNLCREINQ